MLINLSSIGIIFNELLPIKEKYLFIGGVPRIDNFKILNNEICYRVEQDIWKPILNMEDLNTFFSKTISTELDNLIHYYNYLNDFDLSVLSADDTIDFKKQALGACDMLATYYNYIIDVADYLKAFNSNIQEFENFTIVNTLTYFEYLKTKLLKYYNLSKKLLNEIN